MSLRKVFGFPFSSPQRGNSDFISQRVACALPLPDPRLGRGVRLNTYSDSIGPVCGSVPKALNCTGPSSVAVQGPPWRKAEQAFTAHGEAVAIGWDEFEEVREVVVQDVGVDQFLALAIHDADVDLVRMQIDSAIVFGRGSVVFHCRRNSLLMGVV